MKRSYEKELIVRPDGRIDHNSCIFHYLLYAFGECTSKHEARCPDCDQLFDFLDFESVSLSIHSQIMEYKEKSLYYLLHQMRKVYLNAQFKAALSELNSNGADYKMRVLLKSTRETK